MAEITMLVLHPDQQYCDQVAAAFAEYDSEMVIESLVDLREATKRVAEEKPALVVVGVDTPNDPALKTIEHISAGAGVGIIAISKQPTQELLVSCMRAGTDEFLQFPLDAQQLAEAMDGLFKRKGIVSARSGKVTAVFSAAGGVGVTTIATNLAVGIAEEVDSPDASCIIDMHPQFGAVALALDVREIAHTLADAAQEHERLDENMVRSFMSKHSSGAAVLPAPLSLSELDSLDPWHVRSVIQTCRKVYQHVVLDMPHQIDDCSIVGLDEADEILLVCDMVLLSIRNTIRALDTFKELEYSKDKVRLIVNRHYDSHQVSLDEIVKHVGLPVHWLVPYDSRSAIAALNSGQALELMNADSQAARSLISLARHTAGLASSARASKKKRGFFSWSR